MDATCRLLISGSGARIPDGPPLRYLSISDTLATPDLLKVLSNNVLAPDHLRYRVFQGGLVKTELKWVEPHEGHFHANIDDRCEYRVHVVSTGGFRAERVDDGFVHHDLGRAATATAAQAICQDLHTREMRRAAWEAYMAANDPPGWD
jgi:hypothetical protein